MCIMYQKNSFRWRKSTFLCSTGNMRKRSVKNMNSGQFALIKKDIRGITSNKQIFAVLLIVPLVLTIVLPSIFVFVISFAPDDASDFQKLLDMLPVPNGEYSQQQRILGLILNNIMPPFFLIVPIMASSVMAASQDIEEIGNEK
mgnify:CR=1 FL=1